MDYSQLTQLSVDRQSALFHHYLLRRAQGEDVEEVEECAVDPLGYWVDLAWLVCYLCLLVHYLTHGFAEH